MLKYCLVTTILILLTLYSCKNCDLVDVPYTEPESYTVMENQDVTLTYSIENNNMYYNRTDGMIIFGENPKFEVYCTVTNTSEYGGEFEFYATITSQGDKLEFSQQNYIGAGNTHKFDIIKEINPYTFKANNDVEKWGIRAPTITVKKEVTKYRDVTKYRKCNPCEEDCGKQNKRNGIPWYVYIIIIFAIIGIIAWVKEKYF